MKRLLAIEFQKIWLNKASRNLSITYFILLSFIALISSIEFDFGVFKFHLADMGIFNFPYIWHFNTYIAAWLKFFLAIVIVSMMANEYSYGTLKQNLIDGLSKKEFILSKFLMIIVFASCSTVFVFIMSLLLGYSFSDTSGFSVVFTDIDYLLAFFVKLTGFFSFCLFLGILVKRSAFAIGFLLVWYVAENIIQGFLNFRFFQEGNTAATLGRLLPLESISNLIIEPFSRLSVVKNIETQIGIENIKDYSVHYLPILIVSTWTIVFLFSSHKLLKNRDL